MRFLRLSEVIHLTGLSKSSIYLQIKNQSFPPQIRLSARSVAWRESDVCDWMEETYQRSVDTSRPDKLSVLNDEV